LDAAIDRVDAAPAPAATTISRLPPGFSRK
jgi:hypothetical protein